MKMTNRLKLNQFVIIPTLGFAWGDKGLHFYFTWLRFRLGFILKCHKNTDQKDTVQVLIKNEPVNISITKNNSRILLTEDEWKDLYREVEMNLYYRSDIIQYFTDNNADYDTDALLKDTELIDDIVYDYAQLRFDNNGCDPDEKKDWLDCLNEVLDDYEKRLSKYNRKGDET